MHYGDNMPKSSQQASLTMPVLSWENAGGKEKPTQIPTPASQPGKEGNKSTGCNLPLSARFIMQDFLEMFPEIALCASFATGAPSWHVGNA
jgi:hypothetical protein